MRKFWPSPSEGPQPGKKITQAAKNGGQTQTTPGTRKFINGVVIGLIYIYVFFGFELDTEKTSYHINIFNIHWHHWVLGVITLLISELFKNNYTEYIRGCLLVIIIHGLLYEDRFDFSIKEKYK